MRPTPANDGNIQHINPVTNCGCGWCIKRSEDIYATQVSFEE